MTKRDINQSPSQPLWQDSNDVPRKSSLPAMLRLRSISPLPLPSKEKSAQIPKSTYALRVLQDDQKYKLTHQHHVLRAVAGVRDLMIGDRNYSSFKTSSFVRFSKGIRAIGAAPSTPVVDEYLSRNREDYETLSSVNQILKQNSKIIQARKVMVDANLELWMRQHGKEVTGAESRGFTDFLKNLFDALNEGAGFVTPKGLMAHLISLGLVQDPKVLTEVMQGLFATNDLESIRMKKDHFLSLFKVKKSTDHILRLIHSTLSCSSPSTSPKTLPQVHFPFPTFSQFHSLLQKWWSEVTFQSSEFVHIRKLSEFLASKAIVGNKHEGKRLILSSGLLTDEKYVRFPHFVNIFAPAMLKSSLLNVAKGMNSESFRKCASPLGVKMAAFERKLIFEGLKSQNEESKEKIVFNAYCEYTKMLRLEGKHKGKQVENGEKYMPKIVTDVELDIPKHSRIAEVLNVKTRRYKGNRSTPRPDITQTPDRLRPLNPFSRKVPVSSTERILRDNHLHSHFSEMVNFTTDISGVLADCQVPEGLPRLK